MFIVPLFGVNGTNASTAESFKASDYNETRLLSFTRKTNLHVTAEEYKIELSVDLRQIALSGLHVLEKVDTIAQNSSLFWVTQSASTIHNATEKCAYKLRALMSRTHHRNKRALNSVGDWLRATTNTATLDDIHATRLQAVVLRNKQNEIISQTSALKSDVAGIFEQLKITILAVNNISSFINEKEKEKTEVKEFFARNLDIVQTGAGSFCNAVSAIIELTLSKKIHGDIISYRQLDEIYANLKSKLVDGVNFPFQNLFEVTSQSNGMLKIDDGKLSLAVNVPATLNEKFELYEIEAHPVLSNNVLNMITTNAKFIASQGNRTRIVALEDLSNCLKNAFGEFICSIPTPLLSYDTDNCVTRAFRSGSTDRCTHELHRARIASTMIVRKSKNVLIVLTHSEANITIDCLNSPIAILALTRSTTLTFVKDCFVSVDGLTFLTTTAHEEEINANISDFTLEVDLVPLAKSVIIKLPTINIDAGSDFDALGKNIKKLNEDKLIETNAALFRMNEISIWASIGACATSVTVMIILVACVCLCIKI